MKESTRAAREEVALRRQAAAVKELVGEEKAAELDALSGPARYPEVNALLQQEMIADILEDLVAHRSGTTVPESIGQSTEGSQAEITLTFLTDEQREALIRAGYGSDEALHLATDDELIAVEHVGGATVKKVRKALEG